MYGYYFGENIFFFYGCYIGFGYFIVIVGFDKGGDICVVFCGLLG